MPTEHQRRIIISAVCLSPPGTMGGNTKIALEVARQFSLSMKVVVLVPEEKVQTLTSNIVPLHNIELLVIRKCRSHRLIRLVYESVYYLKESKRLLERISCSEEDLFFTPSDFHLDVFLGLFLKATFRVQWVASVFLFVPSPLKNIVHGYGFPFVKYVIYYVYQRFLVSLIKLRSDRIVITNDLDRTYFSPRWGKRLFAFYGGVNVEQIEAIEQEPIETKFDLVFCSRLCEQKGIYQLLDIWKLIVEQIPTAKLAVIGNGVPQFEQRLKDKADRLNISHTIKWLGYVNNQEKYRVYRASRLFVHPTVYDNNGMVAAEALCTGLPVIMNDLPSLRQLYTIGCIKSDFSNQLVTAALISNTLTKQAQHHSSKMDRDAINVFRKIWNWPERCRLFLVFLSTETFHAKKRMPMSDYRGSTYLSKFLFVISKIAGRLPYGRLQSSYFVICRSLNLSRSAVREFIDSLCIEETKASNNTTKETLFEEKIAIEYDNIVKKGYIIYALNYSRQSAGLYCLYKLCHDLNAAGFKSFMTWTNYSPSDLNAPVISIRHAKRLAKQGYIVVYPEIVSGNPLKAKKVARWVLNKPGALGGDLHFCDQELIFIYADIFGAGITNTISGKLFLPTIDESIFYDDERSLCERSLECYYLGKASWKDGYVKPATAFEVTRTSPKRTELGKLFRASRVLYCFDNTTVLVYEAIMCGCPVVLIPDGTQTLIDYQNSELGMEGISWGITPGRAVKTDTQAFKVNYARVKKEYFEQLSLFVKKTQTF